VLNGFAEAWVIGGVVGVGLTAAVTLWHLERLTPQRGGPGLWLSWLLVAASALIGSLAGVGGPRGIGEALLVSGLLLLGSAVTVPPEKRRAGWMGWALFVGVLLGAAASVLPGPTWRGLFGLTLLLTMIWTASRAENIVLRPIFNLGVVFLSIAGLGEVAGSLRPSIAAAVEGSLTVLIFGGLVALATVSIVSCVASEIGLLQRRLGDLEDDHDHLLRLSEADPLTGCPTRQALRAWFERWDGGLPVSVVLIDIDNLKRINDQHGHAVGDEALRLVADVLMGSIRPGDLVVRWGGDEFVVVLRGADRESAKRRFTGLISSLQESTEAFPYEETLRVDWGVASCTSPSDISRALAEADESMFAMKRRR